MFVCVCGGGVECGLLGPLVEILIREAAESGGYGGGG